MQLGSSDQADPNRLEQGVRPCGGCACDRRWHAATAGAHCATVHRVPRRPECTAGASDAVRTPLSSDDLLEPSACVCACAVACRMERLQRSAASSMIGVAQAILHVASAVLFPSDVFVVGAAGVHTLLRYQSHDGGPKHAPSLAGTHGVKTCELLHGSLSMGYLCASSLRVCSCGGIPCDVDAPSVSPERER